MRQLETKTIAKSKQNIMELLVEEEIERQLLSYSSRLRPYLNKVEIATFALNRLPVLYATTQQGKQHLLKVGRKRRKDIINAVRQGFAAVQRDPIRQSKPLPETSNLPYSQAETALRQLEHILLKRNLLDESRLSWRNLVRVTGQALRKVKIRTSIGSTSW